MPMLLTDAMADMTTRATTFSRKSRRSALPIVQATFLLGLCVATLASWVDRYTATPTVTYRRSLAAHSGESCTGKLKGWDADVKILACIGLIIGILYIFLGIAIICDDYFTPSLEVISDKLNLSKDVAGATFMAAGSSAPELFTSLLTVLTTQNSAGVGTILGSAVFNLVVIIAFSAFFAGAELHVDWRPMIRDSLVYGLSIFVMVLFGMTSISSDDPALNGKSGYSWWEAVVMIVLYIMYIVMMWNNEKLIHLLGDTPEGLEEEDADTEPESPRIENPMNAPLGDLPSSVDLEEGAEGAPESAPEPEPEADSTEADDEAGDAKAGDSIDLQDTQPASLCGVVYMIISLPYSFLFGITTPQCDLETHKNPWLDGKIPAPNELYWGGFLASIIWISVLTYWMVVWAEMVGCIVGINSFLMGLVVLASGTSVPDALASISVAKDGHGGMACSNAIGSNIFDVFLGLGIPFTVYSVLYQKAGYATGDEVEIFVAGVQLVVILIIVLVALKCHKWTLTKTLAAWLMSLYAFYVLFNVLVDRDVIPLLGPLREMFGVELVDCTNERC